MFDPKKLLDDLLGSQIPGTGSTVRDKAGQAVQMAKDNPLAAGALAAVLLGTGAGREVTGAAVKLGGLAAIGGLAYKAYQNYKTGNAPSETPVAGEPELLPPPADTAFHPSQAPQGEDEFTLTLVRAMISAAKADGHVDDEEREKIAGKLKLAGIGSDAEKFLMAELESTARPRCACRRRPDRCAEAGALYRVAPHHRTRYACRTGLPRSARRSPRPAGCAGRPCRGNGIGGKGACSLGQGRDCANSRW